MSSMCGGTKKRKEGIVTGQKTATERQVVNSISLCNLFDGAIPAQVPGLCWRIDELFIPYNDEWVKVYYY